MPKHGFQSGPAARIYINGIVTFSFPMEGSSFLPALAKESLSVTKPYIILKDGPLQKLHFPSIYYQLSAVPVCSRGTMIYHSPKPAEQLPRWKSRLRMLCCNFSCAVKSSFLKACKPERRLLPPQGSHPTGKPKYFILKGHKFRDCWQTKHLKASLLISFTNVSFLI